MLRLTVFELQKIWGRRNFLFSACLILLLNLFLLWYTGLSSGNTPEPASYRSFAADLQGLSEKEKHAFVTERKELMDGIQHVQTVLAMEQSEIGAMFAEQERNEHPGVFEAYFDCYQSGEYLRYTDSLEREISLTDEMYEENALVISYEDYLNTIQEQKSQLSGISIFASQDQDSFSARNIRKSAEDHAGLTTENVRWMPSRPIASAMENLWTDVLLILLSFLFMGGLITEEKQKGLFPITRSTRLGLGPDLSARLLALLIHCFSSATALYGSNLLFFGATYGWPDLTARLQSLAPYICNFLYLRA